MGMGCFQSSLGNSPPSKRCFSPKNPYAATRASIGNSSPAAAEAGVPQFSEFSFSDLKSATSNFRSDFIVSGNREKAPNVVYRGRLQNQRWIAVKKFSKLAWPDLKQFAEEAKEVGKLRHKRLANLIGYCAREMKGCSSLSLFPTTPSSINGDPRLSCFVLMKNSRDGKSYSTNLAYTPPEYLRNGRVTPESVIFSVGVLLDLLSGKQIPPTHDLHFAAIRPLECCYMTVQKICLGNFSSEEATADFNLASQCLQYEPRERPNIKDLIKTLAPLQSRTDVASNVLMGITRNEIAPPSPPQHPVSRMGDACARLDLTAIHEILVTIHDMDDEGTNELSFQEWTQQMKDVIEATAIDCYSQFISLGTMVSLTVFARRSMCHLFDEQADAALRGAIQAQCIYPDWLTAFYLQSVALSKLDKNKDAANMLKEVARLEEIRQKHVRS